MRLASLLRVMREETNGNTCCSHITRANLKAPVFNMPHTIGNGRVRHTLTRSNDILVFYLSTKGARQVPLEGAPRIVPPFQRASSHGDNRPLAMDAGQDAPFPQQVPLHVQHEGAFQGIPGTQSQYWSCQAHGAPLMRNAPTRCCQRYVQHVSPHFGGIDSNRVLFFHKEIFEIMHLHGPVALSAIIGVKHSCYCSYAPRIYHGCINYRVICSDKVVTVNQESTCDYLSTVNIELKLSSHHLAYTGMSCLLNDEAIATQTVHTSGRIELSGCSPCRMIATRSMPSNTTRSSRTTHRDSCVHLKQAFPQKCAW